MVMGMLRQRMAEDGLRLHPGKTRLVPVCSRPPRRQGGGKGPGTFDFPGFTLLWQKTRKGHWGQNFKTRKARLEVGPRRLLSTPSTPAGPGAARLALQARQW